MVCYKHVRFLYWTTFCSILDRPPCNLYIVEAIKAEIESSKGIFQIKKAPFVDELIEEVKPPADPANPNQSVRTTIINFSVHPTV